jgi:hypothetical protein
LLSSTLDIFEARARANALNGQGLSSDYGLLKNVDERLAMFGWETNTGVRFVVGVDMRGSGGEREEEVRRGKGVVGGLGLREGEMKIVSLLPVFGCLWCSASLGKDGDELGLTFFYRFSEPSRRHMSASSRIPSTNPTTTAR